MNNSENQALKERIKTLEREKRLLSIILKNIPNSIYFKDSKGCYTIFSDSTLNKFGLSKEEELLGATDSQFFHESYVKEIVEKENTVLKSKKPSIDNEEKEIWNDGTLTWSVISRLPLFNNAEEVVGTLGIKSDITKQKEAETALQDNLNFLEVLINTLPTPIFYKDVEGRFQGCNDAFVSLVNKSRAELIGKTVFDIFPKDLAEEFHNQEQHLYKEKGIIHFESSLTLPDNKKLDLIFHQASFINYDGQIVGLVGGIVDITKRKNAEIKLKKSKEELTKLNASKDKFFSIIAHDLKNPFITLLGFSEALLEDYNEMNSDDVLEYLRHIRKTTKKAYQLLFNLLQWSRAQTGQMTYEPVKFDINLVAEENVQLLSGSALSKKLEIKNLLEEELFVYADKDMVNTVIRNLISNAVKFTNAGGKIEIDGKIKNEIVEITVKDNGIGIEETVQKEIFSIDKNKTKQGTNNEDGTGLGLILCKEFIEANGGSIWIKSDLGKGSTFGFNIPKWDDSDKK